MALVSQVRIELVSSDKCLLALASCVVANAVVIRRMRVVRTATGRLYIGMPSHKIGVGKYEELVFALGSELKYQIWEAVEAAYHREAAAHAAT